MAEPAADSASKFHQILISSAMPIVASLSRALKTTEEIPTLSKALVVYLEDNQKILPVLRWCIRNDIKGADAWQEVFRGKSLSVQILSDYFIHSGRVYVKNVLLSRLRKQTKNLEIDSRFEKDPQVIAENVEKLTKLARETLDGIIESAGQFPVNLSKALKYMVKQVNKKFPEKGMVVAGMILFSKLYIPPILTPQLLENSKENTADVSRTAILLSKLMQSVAAGTPLDSSNILFKFNDFIVYYSEKLKQFTYGLASIPETPTTAEMLVKIEPDVAKKSFQTIHNFIHQYRHTMLDYRVTKKNASEIKIFQDLVTITEQMLSDLVDGKSLFDELPYTQENGTLSRSRSPTVAERGRKEGSGTPLSPRSPEKKIKQPTSPRYAALEDSSSGNEKEMSQARAIKSKLDDENTRLRKEIKIMQQKIEEKEKLLRQFKLKLAKSLSYRQRKTRHVRQVQKKLVNERFNIRNIEDLDKPLGAPFDPRNRSSTLETPRASSDAGYDASTSPLSSPRNNPSMKDEYSFDASTWSIEEESSRSDSQRSKPSESSESLSSSRKDVSPQPTPDRKGSSGTKMVSPSSKLLDRVRTTPAPVSGGSSPKTPSSERKSTTTVEK